MSETTPQDTFKFEILSKNAASVESYLASLNGAIDEYPAEAFGPPPHDLDEYRQSLSNRRATTIAGVDQNGEVQAGVTLFREDLGSIHVLALFCRKAWAGRRMGARLLANALRYSAALGADQITVDVMPSNLTAIRLYETAGFTTYAQSIGPDHSYWMLLSGHQAVTAAEQKLQQLYMPPKQP